MNDLTEQQLLRNYAKNRSEAAFTELVRRNIDFIHSAALRMVRDPHLAEDVTQGVFLALANSAAQLTDRLVLSGWLHRTAQNLAANVVRSDVRRRAREQEAAAMIELSTDEPDIIWEQIAPALETALAGLDEADRDVLFLRYFQHKSAREISMAIGISEEAAKKRVSRAVDHLREFFARRGITVGAGGIVVAISTNAVQAAPIGLTTTIATAATPAGVTMANTQVVAMTTLQKAVVGVLLVAAVFMALHEARRASRLRDESLLLQQQQAQLTGQLQQLQQEGGHATNQLALLTGEVEKNGGNNSELLRLRSQVGLLQGEKRQMERDRITAELEKNAPPFRLLAVLTEPGANSEFMEERRSNDQVVTYCVEKKPLLDQSAITSVRVRKNQITSNPEIEIVLASPGKEFFAKFTRDNIGKQVALVAYGRLYSTPVINGEIPSGMLVMSGFLAEEEANALAARINAAIHNQ